MIERSKRSVPPLRRHDVAHAGEVRVDGWLVLWVMTWRVVEECAV